jgi:hypothetical protein
VRGRSRPLAAGLADQKTKSYLMGAQVHRALTYNVCSITSRTPVWCMSLCTNEYNLAARYEQWIVCSYQGLPLSPMLARLSMTASRSSRGCARCIVVKVYDLHALRDPNGKRDLGAVGSTYRQRLSSQLLILLGSRSC